MKKFVTRELLKEKFDGVILAENQRTLPLFACRARCAGIILLFALSFVSCDILRISPFEVSRWSPGGGYHGTPENIAVSLVFSHEPDKASVEKYFSLTDDTGQLSGEFYWENKKMTFLPTVSLEKNRNYVIGLSADACDSGGLSLDRAFEGRFTTRSDEMRPLLLSCVPEMNSVIDDLRSEIRLEFSRPVSFVSPQNHISFNPHMNGSWRLENTAAIFTPAEPWGYGKRYAIRVSASFAGDNGKTMGKDFLSVFMTGTDREKPFLANAWRITKDGRAETLEEFSVGLFGENHGWESGDKIRLNFSKPVNILSVKNCLDIEGTSPLIMEAVPEFAEELIFALEKYPEYNSCFTVTLKAGVKDCFGNESKDSRLFRISADGINSKPPELVGIRLPLSPGSAGDREIVSFGIDALFSDLAINDGVDRYPFSKETETWIECYFDTSPEARINPFSLMELFKISTSNNALVFSPRSVSETVFSAGEPDSFWEKYQRLEIKGTLTNTVNSGVVNIEIAPGLKDSAGNTNGKMFRISLLK